MRLNERRGGRLVSFRVVHPYQVDHKNQRKRTQGRRDPKCGAAAYLFDLIALEHYPKTLSGIGALATSAVSWAATVSVTNSPVSGSRFTTKTSHSLSNSGSCISRASSKTCLRYSNCLRFRKSMTQISPHIRRDVMISKILR